MDGIGALLRNDGIAEVEYNYGGIIDMLSIVGVIVVAIEDCQCEQIPIGLEGAGIVRADSQALRPKTHPYHNIQIRFDCAHLFLSCSCVLAYSLSH